MGGGDPVDGMKNRVDSADICEQQCRARADCLGFSYVPQYDGDYSRTCWLKNNLDDRRNANGLISGLRKKCENSDGTDDYSDGTDDKSNGTDDNSDGSDDNSDGSDDNSDGSEENIKAAYEKGY